jgi:hypothetical protein
VPRQTFNELFDALSVTPTAVANSTVEAIIVPDFVFPAKYFIQGTTIRGRTFGQISNVVTAVPTVTMRVRFGSSTLSATAVFASAAIGANATANTNLSWRMEWTATCRTSGSAGTIMLGGQLWFSNLVLGTAAGQSGAQPFFMPASSPATQTLDTTIANVCSISAQWSAANAANSIQPVIHTMESLN